MKRRVIGRIPAVLIVILIILAGGCGGTPSLEGVVFEDRDADGIRDADEGGLPDLLVSNGITVTLTDEAGAYYLPLEGHFVFITTPSDHTTTTPWYRCITDENLDFGLTPAPEKDAAEFVFVQITDIHLDTAEEHIAFLEQAIEEINEIAPAFVIATGDLVNGADGVMISQAREWFDAYYSLVSDFDMPIYNTVGNHDVVGIHCAEVDETEPGYNKQMYRHYFGPTYYSFDWGSYHCVVLDPNELTDGRQVFRVPDYQLGWLQQDLAHRQGKPLLVFFHEPTTLWQNRADVLNLLKQRQEMMFAGHWHSDILMDSQGIPEQVTGALCGEWWFGPCPDGKPCGYRIISIADEDISTFYKEVGVERQINITSPSPMVSGETALTAQLYSEHGAIQEAFFSIDDGEAVPMQIEEGKVWDTVSTLWDATQVEQGYHTITIEAKDETGTFSREMEVKVTEEETVPIGELISHFQAYQGQYANVKGTVSFVAMGEPFAEEGTGAIVMTDESAGMVIIAEECIAPPLPTLAPGDLVMVKAVPIKFSWESVKASEQFSMIQQFSALLPEGLLETDETGPVAIRVMRMLSGDDVQKLAPAQCEGELDQL